MRLRAETFATRVTHLLRLACHHVSLSMSQGATNAVLFMLGWPGILMMTMKMMRMSKAAEITEMMAEDLMSSKWNQMNEMSSEQLLVNSRKKAM